MKHKAGVIMLAAFALGMTACTPGAESDDPGVTTIDSATPQQPATGTLVGCTYFVDEPFSEVAPPPGQAPAEGTISRTLHMAEGDVTITMDRGQAPCTVNSFVSLADQGFYDETVCHRLVDEQIFILQCGDPTASGYGGPGYSYADELSGNETYPAGTVAMANAGPDTNGSQFFFVFAETPLPPQYTVFGTLDAQSLAVIQDIAAAGVSDTPPRPASPAQITSVSE